MRINTKGTICGYPALEVRRLLRRADGDLSIDFACQVLDVDARTAIALIQELEAGGYIQKDPDHRGCWRTTVKGSALTTASAARALTRATADKLLLEFLARVEHLRDDPQWCYEVDRAVLFGSYLSDAPSMGDVDVGISFRRRHEDREAHQAAEDLRRRLATDAGRQFPHFAARVFWPKDEVGLFLRARRLSLHELEVDGDIIESGAHVTIYTDGEVCRSALPILGDWTAEKARGLREASSATKAVRSVKRKKLALEKKAREQQEILAKLQTYTQMTPEERTPHESAIRELIVRAQRLLQSLPEPTDDP